MSANHSLTLILTLSCLVRSVAASDLSYSPTAQAGGAPPIAATSNQLILAEYQEQLPEAPKKQNRFKFFSKSPSTTATSDQARLSQPDRISAGKPTSAIANQVTNQQPSELQTSRNFMDRLRQLSTGEAAPKPEGVSQASRLEESTIPAESEVTGIVYAVDDSKTNNSAKPEILLTQVYSEQLEHALSAIPAVETIEPTAKQSESAPVGVPYPEPDKIVFRPAVIDVNRYGQAVLRPDVLVASQQEDIMAGDMEALPPVAEPVVPEEWSAPLITDSYQQYQEHCEPRLGPIQALCGRVCARLNGPCGCEPGLGTERVMHAISFVDTTQPMQNFRLRFDAAYDYQSPDRAEYFWAKIGGGRGPGNAVVPAPTVDYQDIRPYMEVGGDKFSVGTDVPIRIVDPSLNINGTPFGNHSGIGDINITTKLLFLDGKDWQITNLFRTHIPSGDPGKGLGTGHASIEPGFAMRYKWSNYTYLHGDLKYWVPLGGDVAQQGEVLNYGIAISHVWRETDTYAIMPTFEFKGYSFLSGQETISYNGVPLTSVVDPEGVLIAHPGIRWAWDHGTDCGLREIGIFGGFAMTSQTLYQDMIRLEFRWNW